MNSRPAGGHSSETSIRTTTTWPLHYAHNIQR
jgi:hypothetical protein